MTGVLRRCATVAAIEMTSPADALRDPIALLRNRIPRCDRGGRALDELRGEARPRDDDRPADWVGSATRATFALPAAAAADARLSGEGLELILCLPPSPDALDAAPLPMAGRG